MCVSFNDDLNVQNWYEWAKDDWIFNFVYLKILSDIFQIKYKDKI